MALYSSNWGESENGPRPTPDPRVSALVPAMGVSVEMPFACAREAVWNLVTAVERIGEFSPECAEAWWAEGFPARTVGGRFEGRNRVEVGDDVYEWIRPCDVTAYDEPTLFAYTVGDRFDGTPATRWTFRITATDTGCLVEQQFEHLPDGLSGVRLQAEELAEAAELIAQRRVGLSEGMKRTLERIREVLEA